MNGLCGSVVSRANVVAGSLIIAADSLMINCEKYLEMDLSHTLPLKLTTKQSNPYAFYKQKTTSPVGFALPQSLSPYLYICHSCSSTALSTFIHATSLDKCS